MLDFFKRIIPNFEKKRLLNQANTLATISQRLGAGLLAILNGGPDGSTHSSLINADFNGKTPLKAEFQLTLKRAIQGISNKQYRILLDTKDYNPVLPLMTIMQGIEGKAKVLQEFLNKEFGAFVVTSAMTFKQKAVIEQLGMLEFAGKYTTLVFRQMLDEIMVTRVPAFKSTLLPGDLKWLANRSDDYIEALHIVLVDDIIYRQDIMKMSDVVIQETVTQEGYIDPIATEGMVIRLGVVAKEEWINPITLFNDWWVEYENKRYEADIATKNMTLLQIQVLEEQTRGESPDPSKLKQIEYYRKLVQDLEAKIRTYEEKAGVV